MTRFAVVAIISVVCTWALAPRCFTYFDAREVRRRLHGSRKTPPHQSISDPIAGSAAPSVATDTSRLLQLSHMVDSLARASRTGMPSIEAALSELEPHHPDDVLCKDLLLSTVVNGVLVSSALDHVASLLRDLAACRADVAVAASQARLSARMLTYMPFAALFLAVIFSSHFRFHLFTLPVVLPLALGIALNRIGWAWILRLIHRSLTHQATELAVLTDHLCVSLSAGHPLSFACELWEHTASTGTHVARQLQAGQPLDQALAPLEHNLGAGGAALAGVIRQAHRDGLPVVATVARLSSDARAERRRQTDALIRQLPTKLSVPLVLCVLPSFLLAAVVPLAVSNLTRLTVPVAVPSPLQP
jgi:tight adherence protein B